MWSDGVVVVSPLLDKHLGLLECVEDLTIEQLVSELTVEALVEAVLRRAIIVDEAGVSCSSPALPKLRRD